MNKKTFGEYLDYLLEGDMEKFDKNEDEKEKEDKKMDESSTEDAYKSLKAIIGFLEKQETKNESTKEMIKMAKDIEKYYQKEKSFSPNQAKWIYSTSRAIFS